MDVFFTKLPQALSFCRAKLYREQPWLSATGSVVPYPSFADSNPFGHITDVEQTLGFGEKWRRFQEFEGSRDGDRFASAGLGRVPMDVVFPAKPQVRPAGALSSEA